jgi:hypothetical protein
VSVSTVGEQDGAQQVQGYVTLSPAAFLHAWRARSGVHVEGEEEGFEAEVEVEAGGRRVAWKLRRVCDNGSSFLATVTGETD